LVASLILASTSERRKKLLNQIGIKPSKIINPEIDESSFKNKNPTKLVVELAFEKALAVKKKINIKDTKYFIVAGDTIVYRAKKFYNKTNDLNKVKHYLKELSGKKHFVYGGICIISPNGIVSKKLVKTEVFFNKINDQEFTNDKLLNEGIGKSGGYAIQGIATKFIKKIKGSYTNVVGLSLSDVYNILMSHGFFK
tara:strand:- start:1008 stop:1595 length:588 start_codon:yes stop_codon:yes gene_type:complete